MALAETDKRELGKPLYNTVKIGTFYKNGNYSMQEVKNEYFYLTYFTSIFIKNLLKLDQSSRNEIKFIIIWHKSDVPAVEDDEYHILYFFDERSLKNGDYEKYERDEMDQYKTFWKNLLIRLNGDGTIFDLYNTGFFTGERIFLITPEEWKETFPEHE